MLLSYFKIAIRNLWKHATSSVINLLGLTIGLSCCLFIGLYIQHEVSYDRFEEKGDRIARVIMEYSFDGGETNKGNYTSTKVAPAFKRNFPEVESAVRMWMGNSIVAHDEKVFTEKEFLYTDSSFFNIFTYKLVQGNPQTVLAGPGKVVLTTVTAQKYFGNANPVGQTLLVGADQQVYEVTGVIDPFPANSQIQFDFLASFSSLGAIQEQTYWEANYTTYLLLKDKASFASLQQKIGPFMKKEMASESKVAINFSLEPFRDVHLHSPYDGFEPAGNITYIYILAGVALLILGIACFTYVNLATARSMERAREVGIRKVMGALKKQLFWQFIGESAVLAIAALLFSIVLIAIAMPAFNQLAEKELQISSLLSGWFILFALCIIAFVSLLGGAYPALVLSGFQPVRVLKGMFRNTGSGVWVRKSLIIFQFSISVFLVVASLVIQQQLYFIRHKKLGFDREHVLALPLDKKMLKQWQLIKHELTANADVKSVSRSVGTPAKIVSGNNMRSAAMPEDKQFSVNGNPVDEDFISTMGLQIIAGTGFSEQDIKDVDKEQQKDKHYHYILNESAAGMLGWTPQEAIGKRMFLGNQRPGTVNAVVKDFHFQSLRNAIKPLVLYNEIRGNTMLVKVSGHHLPETISYIKKKWQSLVPYQPFEYRFLDEDFNRLYHAETKLGNILNLFTGIAIALACLGLFGLSSYTAHQRVKEIGIRKVLGASATVIVTMLSRDFIRLSCIAMLVAIPVACFVMHGWLQDFTYRIHIGVWIPLLAVALTLLVTLFTTSIKAIQAALMNPVKALRSE